MLEEVTVSVGGVPIRVVADHDASALLELLVGPVVVVDEAPVARLEIVTGQPQVPTRAPDAEVPKVRVWRDPDRVILAVGEVVTTMHGRENRVEGPAARLLGAAPTLRPHLLAHLLVTAGVFVVHAAVLVSDDATVLAMGNTGAGKSTLALAALEAPGWTAAADDVALVRCIDGVVSVATLGLPLHLPADLGGRSTTRAPELGNDPRGRRVVPVEPFGFQPVTDIVSVGHSPAAEASVTRWESRRAMLPLIDSFAVNPDPVARADFMAVAARLARGRVWRLEHAADPARRLRGAIAALERIVAPDPSAR